MYNRDMSSRGSRRLLISFSTTVLKFDILGKRKVSCGLSKGTTDTTMLFIAPSRASKTVDGTDLLLHLPLALGSMESNGCKSDFRFGWEYWDEDVCSGIVTRLNLIFCIHGLSQVRCCVECGWVSSVLGHMETVSFVVNEHAFICIRELS